jgi:hypothetical protein
MKKHVKIIGVVFAILVFASCKLEKGGTIEVINDSDYNASITILKGIMPVDGGAEKRATAGGKVTFSIGEDGTYNVNANFYETLPPFAGHGTGEAVLSGGNIVTVRVKPSP